MDMIEIRSHHLRGWLPWTIEPCAIDIGAETDKAVKLDLLPSEVFRLILSHIPSLRKRKKTAVSLMRTRKRLAFLIQPIFYEAIELEIDEHPGSLLKILYLYLTLSLRRPDLARCVRYISFQGRPPSGVQRSTFELYKFNICSWLHLVVQNASQLPVFFHKVAEDECMHFRFLLNYDDPTEYVYRILCLLPRIETLRLGPFFKVGQLGYLLSNINSFSSKLGKTATLENLKNVEYTRQDEYSKKPQWQEFSEPEDLLKLIQIPSIRSLRMQIPDTRRFLWSKAPFMPSHITSLDLYAGRHSQGIADQEIWQLLVRTPLLDNLSLGLKYSKCEIDRPGSNYKPYADCSIIKAALGCVGGTLRTLSLSLEFTQECESHHGKGGAVNEGAKWGVKGALTPLPWFGFRQLFFIDAPLCLFYGWSEALCDRDVIWDPFVGMPECVQRIVLRNKNELEGDSPWGCDRRVRDPRFRAAVSRWVREDKQKRYMAVASRIAAIRATIPLQRTYAAKIKPLN